MSTRPCFYPVTLIKTGPGDEARVRTSCYRHAQIKVCIAACMNMLVNMVTTCLLKSADSALRSVDVDVGDCSPRSDDVSRPIDACTHFYIHLRFLYLKLWHSGVYTGMYKQRPYNIIFILIF